MKKKDLEQKLRRPFLVIIMGIGLLCGCTSLKKERVEVSKINYEGLVNNPYLSIVVKDNNLKRAHLLDKEGNIVYNFDKEINYLMLHLPYEKLGLKNDEDYYFCVEDNRGNKIKARFGPDTGK